MVRHLIGFKALQSIYIDVKQGFHHGNKYLAFNFHTELDVPVELGASVDGTVELSARKTNVRGKLPSSQNRLK